MRIVHGTFCNMLWYVWYHNVVRNIFKYNLFNIYALQTRDLKRNKAW